MIFVARQLYDERVFVVKERCRADRTALVFCELLFRHAVKIGDEVVGASFQLGGRVVRFLHERLDEGVHEVVVGLIVRCAGAASHHVESIGEESVGGGDVAR